ncbi:MAG: hypothetical protein KIT20_12265 [Alphaproteobacteria bacterium]|nr:hypothetical protein [Alphaproteobacteria bacterium]
MVQLNVSEADFVAGRRKVRERKDTLSEFDRTIVREVVRLDIPLPDPVAMREIADKLKGLANTIDALSHRHEVGVRHQLLLMRLEVENVQRWMRGIRKSMREEESE